MIENGTLPRALDRVRAGDRYLIHVGGPRGGRRLAYGELHERALGLLHHFQVAGADAGAPLILLLDDNEQVVDAFWAALYGGIVPVPVAAGAADEHRRKFLTVFETLGRPRVCTTQRVLDRMVRTDAADGLDPVRAAARERSILLDLVDDISQPGRRHEAKPDDVAFIQFSSGSTSTPKGVLLTHRNLLVNIAAIVEAAAMSSADTFLSWMPLTHDMGIIGFHLTPLVLGVPHTIMATETFVRRPAAWLELAARERATILCSPNFGYAHFLKAYKREKMTGLDLRAVRLLFNGAEPISAALARRFTDTMAAHGLSPRAMYPVYGLAEASLAVSFPPVHREIFEYHVDRDSLGGERPVALRETPTETTATFVGVGSPIPNCEMRITSAAHEALPERHVGHIEIRGENVCRGYYGGEVDPEMRFGPGGWLDTGDLGFVVDGELVVTGRAKDMLCIHGQNYYPNDLETVAEQSGCVELGKVAVAGVYDEKAATDSVVVFVQHRASAADFAPIARELRAHISRHTGLEIGEIVPIARIPKTTSGKIQRYLLQERFAQGEFDDVLAEVHRVLRAEHEARPGALTDLERELAAICARHMSSKDFGVDDNLLEAGESSLTLAMIHEEIDARWPECVDIEDFFEYPTIAELARCLETRLNAA